MRDFTTDLKPKPKPTRRRWRRGTILLVSAALILAIAGVGYAVATALSALGEAIAAVGTAVVAAIAVLLGVLVFLLGVMLVAAVRPVEAVVAAIVWLLVMWDEMTIVAPLLKLLGLS